MKGTLNKYRYNIEKTTAPLFQLLSKKIEQLVKVGAFSKLILVEKVIKYNNSQNI